VQHMRAEADPSKGSQGVDGSLMPTTLPVVEHIPGLQLLDTLG
jgi:hypothetical protein